LVFHVPDSSCGCVSHCLTRVSKECGASAVACSRVLRLLVLTVGSHIFAYPSATVPSHVGLICLAILPNRSASVHQNLLPRLYLSVLRNLRPRICPCCPTCHQITTLQRLNRTSTKSSVPFLGAFALSSQSQVLKHARWWSWTRWTAMFSCFCWTTDCTTTDRDATDKHDHAEDQMFVDVLPGDNSPSHVEDYSEDLQLLASPSPL